MIRSSLSYLWIYIRIQNEIKLALITKFHSFFQKKWSVENTEKIKYSQIYTFILSNLMLELNYSKPIIYDLRDPIWIDTANHDDLVSINPIEQ